MDVEDGYGAASGITVLIVALQSRKPLGLWIIPSNQPHLPTITIPVRRGKKVTVPWRIIMPHYGVAYVKAKDRDALLNAWVLKPYVKQPWEK